MTAPTPFPKKIKIIFILFRGATLSACLGILCLLLTSAVAKPDKAEKPDFSGNWTLDLQASSSLESLLKRVEASPVDLKYATSTTLKATLQQTQDVLKIATRGPAFALDETLYLDGRNDPTRLKLLGATSINTSTAWSENDRELIETHQIQTNEGKEGELTIKRHLTNGGETLVVVFTLQLKTEPDQVSAQQIWHKKA